MEKYLTLIAKRLANEISDHEQRELQDWLDESEENELLFHRMNETWSRGKYKLVVKGQERVFNKLSAQLGLNDRGNKSARGVIRQMYWGWAAAAVFILSICVVGTWSYLKPVKKTESVSYKEERIIRSNPRGQKSTVILPDGSKVSLNSESYIEFRQDFSEGRQVKLVGEAFFDVVHDVEHPFVVNSGDVMVRVLGTSFNVQAFPFDESMSVAVVTGRVLVENTQNSSARDVLLPQEMVRINHKTGVFKKSNYNPDELAWKDDILAFNKASFNEIVGRLERWYGVDFVIRRSVPITDGFTGHYKNPSLKVVLEGMSFSSDFKFTIKGDSVIIY